MRDVSGATHGTPAIDSSYGCRLTTGFADKLLIDICGNKLPSFFRVRCDIVDANIITNNRTFVTNFFARSDCSAVSADIGTDSANDGKAISTMSDMPFTFRTLGTKGFRVVVKKDGVIQNGQQVNVYVDTCANSTVTNFKVSGDDGADLSFNQAAGTAPFPLINAGPSGSGTKSGIPAFTAALVKNTTNPANADFKVFSESPFFAGGGEGIALKSATFRLSEFIQGSVGTDSYFDLAKPTGDETPNADGLYEYTPKSDITGGATKAYLVTCTRVTDAFDVGANVQQTTVTNEPILVENRAAKILFGSLDLSGASVPGGKMVVKFKGNNAPEGFTTIKRFSVYYMKKSRARDICSNAAATDFNITFADIKKTAQVHHIEAADISYAKYNQVQETTITGLTNSDISNNNSMYSVFVTASTLKDGSYLEGVGPSDLSFSHLVGSTADKPAQPDDVSYGTFISGTPAKPTSGTVTTGKDISANTKNNDTTSDICMNNTLNVYFNDYQVDQRGSDYTGLRYAIIKSSDVQYANNEFTADASFHEVEALTYDGTSALENRIIDAGIDACGVAFYYDDNKWKAANTSALKQAANGTSYSIKYALVNACGVGDKTGWVPFTPSTMPDLRDSLFSADPSGGDDKSFFGNVEDLASYSAFKVDQTKITSDALAATQGLVVGTSSIKVGWSQKTANQIKNGLDASASLTGGSPITGTRYSIKELANTNSAVRLYGNSIRAFKASESIKDRTQSGANSLTVSNGIDASLAETPLRMGQAYDISFVLVNKNGYNDLSNGMISGFAPMGTLSAPTGLKGGTTAPKMVDATDLKVDICFNDISGVSEHGGHLVTAYDVKIEQIVNGSPTTLRDFVAKTGNSDDMSVDMSKNGLAYSSNRSISTTTTTNKAVAGYPLKVSLKAISRALANSGGTNDAEVDNQKYNKNRANVESSVVSVNLPGPLLSGAAHDEVRALKATAGDDSLVVTFAKPEITAVYDANLADPVVRWYDVYAYDMSLSAATTPLVLNVAHSRLYKKVSTDSIQADSTYSCTLSAADGVQNGKAYMVVVHTRWGYGPSNNLDFTTKGIYSTDATDGDHAINVVADSNGDWKWYAAADPLGQGTAVSAGTDPLKTATSDLAVPSKSPVIIYHREQDANKVVIRDNGAVLTNALMLQLSPAPGSGNNVFEQDLWASDSGSAKMGTGVYQTDANGERILVRDYQLKTGTLGTNWINEQNIIFAANANGVDHVTIPKI